MRLLHFDDNGELSLTEFIGDEIPPYAILSHTWGPDHTEVTYRDILNGSGKDKVGYRKIRLCGQQAAQEQLRYFWVDTCCIDKTSSTELSEALNSMYPWYRKARICYVYLEDVPHKVDVSVSSMENVRWFTRGWTLQELVAPQNLSFYSGDWSFLGTKQTCCDAISAITGIHVLALQNAPVEDFSIAQRMSWASSRVTKRPEDISYCLLGIFNVNMPTLYGEGARSAFVRLQEKIMETSDDQSLFAWTQPSEDCKTFRGLLAHSPAEFAASGDVVPIRNLRTSNPYSQTNAGIRITIPLKTSPKTGLMGQRTRHCVGVLNCVTSGEEDSVQLVVLWLFRLADGGDQFARYCTSHTSSMPSNLRTGIPSETIHVRNVIHRDAVEISQPAESGNNLRERLFAWTSQWLNKYEEVEVLPSIHHPQYIFSRRFKSWSPYKGAAILFAVALLVALGLSAILGYNLSSVFDRRRFLRLLAYVAYTLLFPTMVVYFLLRGALHLLRKHRASRGDIPVAQHISGAPFPFVHSRYSA